MCLQMIQHKTKTKIKTKNKTNEKQCNKIHSKCDVLSIIAFAIQVLAGAAFVQLILLVKMVNSGWIRLFLSYANMLSIVALLLGVTSSLKPLQHLKKEWKHPDLSFISLTDLGSSSRADGNDIWGYTNAAGRKFAITGMSKIFVYSAKPN